MCRIQAQLFKVSFVKYPNVNAMPYWTLIDQDISDDIVDGRDINVGSFDLESISEPNRCCIRGKFISHFIQIGTTDNECHVLISSNNAFNQVVNFFQVNGN